MLRFSLDFLILAMLVCASLLAPAIRASGDDTPTAQIPALQPAAATPPSATESAAQQTAHEDAFAKLLSGATLDGNFTMTDAGATKAGSDTPKLMHDKYTLGDVKKLDGNQWLISARIEYGDKDFTVPLTLPVEWAGDTPVIVVDNVGLPGLGTVSARVLFFADHYAGFWQHGTRTGHLFGVIRHEAAKSASGDSPGH
jgi:hypothetical protein